MSKGYRNRRRQTNKRQTFRTRDEAMAALKKVLEAGRRPIARGGPTAARGDELVPSETGD